MQNVCIYKIFILDSRSQKFHKFNGNLHSLCVQIVDRLFVFWNLVLKTIFYNIFHVICAIKSLKTILFLFFISFPSNILSINVLNKVTQMYDIESFAFVIRMMQFASERRQKQFRRKITKKINKSHVNTTNTWMLLMVTVWLVENARTENVSL